MAAWRRGSHAAGSQDILGNYMRFLLSASSANSALRRLTIDSRIFSFLRRTSLRV